MRSYSNYHRPPPSPPMESDNWSKPSKSHYHRASLKRRCGSPSLFPKKVHVSEEKVAHEFGNLTLCGSSSKPPGFAVQKPDFLVDGKTRRKTFRELEDSIEVDGLVELNDSPLTSVELAPELANEIRKMNRKFLSTGNYRLATKRLPYNPCQELVLWQPPPGSIAQVLEAMKKESATLYDADDEYHKHSIAKLDRIEEEDDSQLQAISQMDEMDTCFDVSSSGSLLKQERLSAFDCAEKGNSQARKSFHSTDMDF